MISRRGKRLGKVHYHLRLRRRQNSVSLETGRLSRTGRAPANPANRKVSQHQSRTRPAQGAWGRVLDATVLAGWPRLLCNLGSRRLQEAAHSTLKRRGHSLQRESFMPWETASVPFREFDQAARLAEWSRNFGRSVEELRSPGRRSIAIAIPRTTVSC